MDDNSVGEKIGTATHAYGTYASTALLLYPGPISGYVRNLEFRYAETGLTVYTPSAPVYCYDLTFVGCTTGISTFYSTLYLSVGRFCDVPTQHYDSGFSQYVPRYITTLNGKEDSDLDMVSNAQEILRLHTDPLNAFSSHSTSPDGAFHLVASSADSESVLSFDGVPVYFSSINATRFRFAISNARIDSDYAILMAKSLNAPIEWHPINLFPFAPYSGRFSNIQYYEGWIQGPPPVMAFFSAASIPDSDFDGLPDGYEINVTKTSAGNPDSRSLEDRDGNGIDDAALVANNGRADGDEDFDSDGLNNLLEYRFGTDPFVTQGIADSDADGLPDWFEGYVQEWALVPDITPTSDTDADGISDSLELYAGTVPVLSEWDTGNYSVPIDEHKRFVSGSFTATVPLGYQPASNPYFPAGGLAGGFFNLLSSMTIDIPAVPTSSSVTATIDYDICPLVLMHPMPSFDTEPDSLDGQLWRGILLNGTDFADGAWAKINEAVLNALHLESIQHGRKAALLRISVQARTVQHFAVLGDTPEGLSMRIKSAMSAIHTELTKLSALTLRHAELAATGYNWIDNFLRAGGVVATAVSWYENLTVLRTAVTDYLNAVKEGSDCTEPAFLSLALQSALLDIPGLPESASSALEFFNTTPLWDPNPLGWYEHGGCF